MRADAERRLREPAVRGPTTGGRLMHGLLFKSLKDHVIENHGEETWLEACEAAGVDKQIYLTIDTYPDEEFVRIADAAADRLGVPVAEFLESHGRFAAGRLLDTYRNVVPDDWTALDLIENTDDRIYDAVRTRHLDVNPPELVCRRDDDARVTVEYRSERRLCSVAKGIARGVGDRYGVRLAVTETACVHDGAECCEFVVER